MKTIIIVLSSIMLFVTGCEYTAISGYDVIGTYMPLNEAIVYYKQNTYRDSSSCQTYYYNYFHKLAALKDQAHSDNDLRIIDQEQLSTLIEEARNCGSYDFGLFKILRDETKYSDIRAVVDEKMAEYERNEQAKKVAAACKQAETLKTMIGNREAFVNHSDVSLHSSTVSEVRSLIVKWEENIELVTVPILEAEYYNRSATLLNDPNWNQIAKFYSLESFYKVFGKPLKKQYLSEVGRYDFWYRCKEGDVQIQVGANTLSQYGIVQVLDLSVF